MSSTLEQIIRQIVREEIGQVLAAGQVETAQEVPEQQATSDLYADVSLLLNKLEISPALRGYRYLREAVMLVYEDQNALNEVTGYLYPTIAQIFDTTPSRVERAIRHAIETRKGSIEHLQFSYRPTPSEFIAAMVERLKLDRKDYYY